MNTTIEVSACLERDQRNRARIGEQAFQVEHYLALWKSYPTAANWQRVTDAARAYDPLSCNDGPEVLSRRLRKGQRVYYLYERSGGRPGSNRAALIRYSRVGARGKVYRQVFRKGSQSWTKEG